ncbi:MAG: hypothetical protein Kow0059_09070 [Candidatus Sumerlaeia bacterium]
MNWKKDTLAFALFTLLTLMLVFPGWEKFKTGFMCDWGDGLQNAWNLWWVHRALFVDFVWPWHTDMLWRPFGGVNLYTHSLNPFNGFVAAPLLEIFPLHIVYNLIVLHTYVVGGWLAYWLGRKLTGSFWAGVAGGTIFSFSPYHFSHTLGHMQTLSLQFLPLYALGLWGMAAEPGRRRWPAAAGVALVLATLCSWYYLLSCAVLGASWFLGWFPFFLPGRRGLLAHPLEERRNVLLNFLAAHGGAAVVLSPVLIGMGRASLQKNYFGVHDPFEFSADLAGFFIPGGISRFGLAFEPLWSRFSGNLAENGYYLGVVPPVLAAVGAVREWKRARPWLAVVLLFSVLAMGPHLQVLGADTLIPLPYLVLAGVLPPLETAGIPVRFAGMMFVGLAVLGALGVRVIFDQLAPTSGRRALIGGAVVCLIVINYLPSSLNFVRFDRPDGFYALMNAIAVEQGDFCILDAPMVGNTIGLYYQTLHQRPLAMGYVSRTPRAYIERVEGLPGVGFITRLRDRAPLDEDLGGFEQALRELKVRYIFNYEIAYADYLRRCSFLDLVYSDPYFEAFRLKPRR